MTVLVPLFIDGLEYPSKEMRRALQTLTILGGGPSSMAARSGITHPDALQPFLEGSTVKVTAGGCVVTSLDGMYLTGCDMVTTIRPITGADATNPRRDLIVLEVLDPKNGGANGGPGSGVLRILDGQPASTPSLPAYDRAAGFYLKLGEVYVPRVNTAPARIVGGPPMTAAAGGTVVVTDKAERDAMYKFRGLTVWRSDLGIRQTYAGARWVGERQLRVAGVTTEAVQENGGDIVIASDPNGFAAWVYPEPFTTRTFYANANPSYNSDPAAGPQVGAVVLQYDSFLTSRTRAVFRVIDLAGNLLKNTSNIRATIHATGD